MSIWVFCIILFEATRWRGKYGGIDWIEHSKVRSPSAFSVLWLCKQHSLVRPSVINSLTRVRTFSFPLSGDGKGEIGMEPPVLRLESHHAFFPCKDFVLMRKVMFKSDFLFRYFSYIFNRIFLPSRCSSHYLFYKKVSFGEKLDICLNVFLFFSVI